MNNKPFCAFYKKRLNTQSFLDTEMSITNITQFTTKIIKSLKEANIQGIKRRQKMQMAQSRLKTKQNKQAESRQKLREKISDKMRLSQMIIQKINSQRRISLSSRSQFQQSQRKKIRQNQKILLQTSLSNMYKTRKQAQKFFRQTQQKKKQQFQRVQKISRVQRTRYGSTHDVNNIDSLDLRKVNEHRSRSSIQVSKPPVKVLKVNESQIIEKQKKKQNLQTEKQQKYLSQYVSKMQDIIIARKRKAKVNKQAAASLPKVINRERSSLTKKMTSHVSADQKNFTTQLKQKSQKKVPFSQMYLQKLKEKKSRKQIFHSLLMHQGDQIMEKQHEKTRLLKQTKIIKQSLNQYRRWSNLIANYKKGR